MRLINVKTHKLEEFPEYNIPEYAILSHTWGDDGEELTIRDIEEGRIHKPGVGSVKFLGSCRQAVQDGLGYVWIDTCCIDKTNLVEFSEAINSMFRWYREASVCYAYLSDVPSDDKPKEPSSKFHTSRWFKRGWTLQELLAPRSLRFYNSEWAFLGTKGTMSTILEKITGIPRQIFLGITELQSTSIAQRMSWAARRETKRQEDIAYCLLGIFDVFMPIIYGEGTSHAFFRLQQNILKTTRDDSILAWGLIGPEQALIDNLDQTGQVRAGRILATAPSDFTHSGAIVCDKQSRTSPTIRHISGDSLWLSLSLLTTSSSGVVGLLNCGPRHDPQQRVGIPLAQTAPDEYVRPEGYHAVLQRITVPGTSPSRICIRTDNPSNSSAGVGQYYWRYDDDDFADLDLGLVDVNPFHCWEQERAIIVSTLAPSGSAIHPILARFRHNAKESPDFVMLLEAEQRDTVVKPKCHVMVCPRNIPLQEFADKLQYMAEKVSGRDSASNGLLHLRVALESNPQQPFFYIKPEVLSSLSDISVNIAAEAQKSDLVLEPVGTWEFKGQNKADSQIAVDNSDSESDVSDVPSIFSTGSAGSDNTASSSRSLVVTRQGASMLLTEALSKDRDLKALYQQAGAQVSKDRFFINHSRLLKAFFQDLGDKAKNDKSDQFLRVTRFLRSRPQREQVTSGIWNKFETRSFIPDNTDKLSVERPKASTEMQKPKQDVVADEEVESGESDEENKHDDQPDPSDEINYVLGLFTEAPAFEGFKSNLKSFLNPPATVEEAVSTRNPVIIRRFIRRHFDEIVDGDYPWIKELRDIGLSDDEVAGILLDQAVDAPWVFFEPEDMETGTIDTKKHVPGCVHEFSALGASKADTVSMDDQWHIKRLVQECCGLAGVAPVSKHRDRWNGSVDFLGTEQYELLEGQVSVSSSEVGDDLPMSVWTSRITGALEQLCLALAQVQSAGLCCNSFTMLHQSDESGCKIVAMRQIRFASIKILFEFLIRMEPWEALTHIPADREILLSILSDILGPLVTPGPWEHADTAAALHYSALAVQTLCLAFLSYSQGHAGALQPFFLDAPIQRVTLCGIEPDLADQYGAVEARLINLSCVGDMLGSPVLCFTWIQPGTLQKDRTVDSSVRYDLLASAQDMIDTWGPGKLILANQGPEIVGVHLGGGVVSAPISEDDRSPFFHWSPYGAIENYSNPRPFHPEFPIRIAAAVTENPHCVRDENEWWTKSCSYASFQDLGTHDEYWKQKQRQIMGQAGNYVVVGVNLVWDKVQAYTLKQRKLESADNELVPFLEDPFGVQVSLCTGVSRRITVRKMLANLMPVFARASIEPEEISTWKALCDNHQILSIFSADTGDMKDWLRALPKDSLREYAMKLIRDVLNVLQYTGFDPDTKLLNIAWPHENNLRKCFQIPCEGKSAWLRFFADSNDCATFAYITTKCLETGHVKCQGSTTPWGNVVTVLETAVLRLSTSPSQVQVSGSVKLEHKMVYFFRKSRNQFYVQAEQQFPAGPMRLVMCSIISPAKVQARVREKLHIRDKQPICLRERRAMDSLLAEQVSVSART